LTGRSDHVIVYLLRTVDQPVRWRASAGTHGGPEHERILVCMAARVSAGVLHP
jgi:hypothetical protein